MGCNLLHGRRRTNRIPSGLLPVNPNQRLFAVITMLASEIDEASLQGQSAKMRNRAQAVRAVKIAQLARDIADVARTIAIDLRFRSRRL